MAGRKPVPTYLKVLEGNPGKRPINKKEPLPKLNIPPCPAHLSQSAKAEWKRITQRLLKLKVISDLDKAALAGYCHYYGELSGLTKDVRAEGYTVTTDKGNIVQNPKVGALNTAYNMMLKFGVEFGLTPSSRSRLQIEMPQDDTRDTEMEDLLSGLG